MQERAADKQSEMDELRARRYQESKDREWRGKERAAAERQAGMMRELAEARAAQKNSTLSQRAEMAKVEHEDFMRVLAVNRSKEHDDMTQVCAAEGGGSTGEGHHLIYSLPVDHSSCAHFVADDVLLITLVLALRTDCDSDLDEP